MSPPWRGFLAIKETEHTTPPFALEPQCRYPPRSVDFGRYAATLDFIFPSLRATFCLVYSLNFPLLLGKRGLGTPDYLGLASKRQNGRHPAISLQAFEDCAIYLGVKDPTSQSSPTMADPQQNLANVSGPESMAVPTSTTAPPASQNEPTASAPPKKKKHRGEYSTGSV